MQSESHIEVASLDRLAFAATVHCLAGCATGEVLGMVIATVAGLTNAATILLAVILAFIFARFRDPLLRPGVVPPGLEAGAGRTQLRSSSGIVTTRSC